MWRDGLVAVVAAYRPVDCEGGGLVGDALREIGKAMPGWYQPDKLQTDTQMEIIIRKL